MNADGYLDAVFAQWLTQNQVCLNDGFGGLACSDMSPDTRTSGNVALGDVDNDGNLDAVIANDYGTAPERNRVCLGDGQGNFVCSDVSSDTYRSDDVSLGDMDGDGNLDAVFANTFSQRNRICLGDGQGAFACSDVNAAARISSGVAIGDVDNNGTLDLVFANEQQRNRVCLGDGVGGFACTDVSPDALRSQDVALGDVDGDGNLDVVFSNSISAINMANRVCLGDGSGGFACADVSSQQYGSQGVALADINNDGDLDAIFANYSVHWNSACLGDGTGWFSCADIVSGTKTNATGVAILPLPSAASVVIDEDGDGIPDDDDMCPGGDDNLDSDGDLVADYCDTCPADPFNDADGDGFCGDVDICAGGDDSLDMDWDGTPDSCDVCPQDSGNDADGDGVCESIDNCEAIWNPDQFDFDSDGFGDACDTDIDNDGVVNGGDLCPMTESATVDPETGCGLTQLCPCDGPMDTDVAWRNHGKYVKCVSHTTKSFVKAGLVSKSVRRDILTVAARSGCGK